MFGLRQSSYVWECDLQVQRQAQKDMQGGNLDESSVNAYFQQHMQKVGRKCSFPVIAVLTPGRHQRSMSEPQSRFWVIRKHCGNKLLHCRCWRAFGRSM